MDKEIETSNLQRVVHLRPVVFPRIGSVNLLDQGMSRRKHQRFLDAEKVTLLSNVTLVSTLQNNVQTGYGQFTHNKQQTTNRTTFNYCLTYSQVFITFLGTFKKSIHALGCFISDMVHLMYFHKSMEEHYYDHSDIAPPGILT